MMNKSLRPLSLLLSTSLFVTLFNGIDFSGKPQNLLTEISLEQPVFAKSKSGGRSGGGSFKKGSSGSRSRSKGSSSYRHDSYYPHRRYHNSHTTYYGRPVPFSA